jgi:hypothetical protein
LLNKRIIHLTNCASHASCWSSYIVAFIFKICDCSTYRSPPTVTIDNTSHYPSHMEPNNTLDHTILVVIHSSQTHSMEGQSLLSSSLTPHLPLASLLPVNFIYSPIPNFVGSFLFLKLPSPIEICFTLHHYSNRQRGPGGFFNETLGKEGALLSVMDHDDTQQRLHHRHFAL